MQGELQSDQYQQVLKYMEATSQDDFQAAKLILKQYNFNLNTAINAKFNRNEQLLNNPPRQNNQRQNRRNNQEEDDEQIIRKYIQHVQHQNQNWSAIGNTYSFLKSFTVGLFKLISQLIVPQFLLRKFLRSYFYILYKDQIKISVEDDSLNRILMNTRQISHKSCFLVLSPNIKCESIINLLNQNDIVKKVQDSFYFVGFVQGDPQLQQINNKNPPEIIICRYNLYKQIVIIKRFVGQQQINSINVGHLDRLVQQGRNCHKRDKNVLIKYRNFIRKQYYGPMHIQEEQEEQINFVARQETTHHIRQQNQEYKRVEQEQLKRLNEMKKQEEQQHHQKSAIEQLVQQRKFRKMSIPDEPQDGDIIRFLFRCPDGSTKNRNFHSDEKVQIIYNWVETNDQIQLEDNKKREFQILYSYPPTPLKDMKQKILKQVFESDQQKLLIRQL